jgi:PTS system glucose-specific IIC component
MGTKAWMLLVVGPAWALLYYAVFRFLIVKFNLRTPGREEETETSAGAAEFTDQSGVSAAEQKAVELVKAFGGRDNIVNLDACITRLRVDLKEVGRASPERLKALGASGVLSVGTGLQAVFGPQSENLKSDMDAAIKRNLPGLDESFAGGAKLAAPSAPSSAVDKPAKASDAEAKKLAQGWLEGLGGAGNIESVETCAGNRLRVVLKDFAGLREEKLREANLPGLMKLKGKALHLLVEGDASPRAT